MGFKSVRFWLLFVVPLFLAVFVDQAESSNNGKREESTIGGALTRLTGYSSPITALVSKKVLRKNCIRYAVKTFSTVGGNFVASKTWRQAAVYTGTRISNYLASGWMPYVSGAKMVYDGVQLVGWLLG